MGGLGLPAVVSCKRLTGRDPSLGEVGLGQSGHTKAGRRALACPPTLFRCQVGPVRGLAEPTE